ncbi:hypothetical protein LWP59_40080 [Amycolatopsis acidiphila]|uniref:Uncharacterized protein n=1 Tax=Amycolatopsis acidiphila TaxID=715473 RepID=A0A558A2D3_9PSEU|nr:hypothetical protein [Amycolatopsis acidiphila]TVT18419.1 hypothetical protein FNH06_27975 [Amycolatopsis acidiphila]UIJ60100.1 hypothetical protein LWP59_40080 [Amycolatopsis acidiphila]GHG61371.1 hypothetical protein GCM10017788_16000 [Amycolatopsis acidiphila]
MAVPIGNVLGYAAVCIVPPAMFWLSAKVPRLIDSAGEYLRRRRLPPPDGPPIERLAADLRRVHRALERLPDNAPVVRRRATNQAYDTLLAQACHAVGEQHWLDTVPDGVEREVERLRVEESLRRCGLAVP